MENRNMDELWKHFFKNPRKNYNIYMFKLMDYPDYIIYDKQIMDSYKGKWTKYFQNDNPICLEIGSGSGTFAKEIANRNKNKNYIALELRFKRLCMSAKKCKDLNLKNIVFFRRLAEEIENFIDENEISEIYINFPDPWENEEKNRIIQKKFFNTLDKILKVNGILFFKTDHDGYYNDVINLINELDNYKIIYKTDDLHNSDKIENNIKTEFESLFIHKHNKNINYIEIQKIK